jgi:hypothetical protein
VAAEFNFSAYVVGGFVRDLLLKHENLDIDIVIEGDAIDFARRFAARFGARSREFQKFKTAVIIFPDGFKIDVATARTEYYEAPGALPVVEYSSIKMDLYRRDFTINTLALKLNPGEFGTLLDFFGASGFEGGCISHSTTQFRGDPTWSSGPSVSSSASSSASPSWPPISSTMRRGTFDRSPAPACSGSCGSSSRRKPHSRHRPPGD